jgi:hypothetical protein
LRKSDVAKICRSPEREELGKTAETGLKAAFGTVVPLPPRIHLVSVVEAKVN